jgi:hypothetical protein
MKKHYKNSRLAIPALLIALFAFSFTSSKGPETIVTYNNGWSSEPSPSSSAVIETTLIVSSNLEIKNLTVDLSAQVIVEPGATLTITGVYTNNSSAESPILVESGGSLFFGQWFQTDALSLSH